MTPLEGEMGPQPLPDEALIDAREQADIDGPLVDWKSKGSQIELVGREAVDGHDAYKLKLTLKSGGVLTAYVDVKSASLVRTEATRHVRGSGSGSRRPSATTGRREGSSSPTSSRSGPPAGHRCSGSWWTRSR